jgi:predicted MPP superfamily phosphohydrolase
VKILLSHRPEIFPQAAKADIDLVLSGHYHGGQVKLGPSAGSLSVARLMTPYAEGFFRLARPGQGAAKTAHLFVSRGIGITGLPIRVNCPPQIAHLRLIKA